MTMVKHQRVVTLLIVHCLAFSNTNHVSGFTVTNKFAQFCVGSGDIVQKSAHKSNSHDNNIYSYFDHDIVSTFKTSLCMASAADDNDTNNQIDKIENSEEDKPKKKKKKKKKPAFIINDNLFGTISSEGNSEDAVATISNAPRATGRLGITSRKSKPQRQTATNAKTQLSKKDKQRTGNGNIDSSKQTLLSDAESKAEEPIQVLEAKRGSKVVTIVRGMTSPMNDRKAMLKELKKKLGGGGTMVDGVLELQGPHSEVVLKALRSKGYNKAKKV